MNTLADLLNQLSPSWWEYTLHATWQAALTTAILLGLAALGRKWPAPWRYGLLLLALFKFAFPPFLSVPSGAFSQLGPQLVSSALARPQSQSLLAAAPGPVQARTAPGRPDAEAEMTSQPDSGRFAAQAASAHSSRGFAKGAGLHWTAWLMLLHFAGCAAMFLWIARQLSRLRQAVRGSRVVTEGPLPLMLNTLAAALRMKRIPALRISDRVTAPVAFGVLHPTILMPATNLSRLSEHELKVILAHELGHFRRGDLWVNWAQLLLQAIWWFNPLLWMLNHALRKAREDCCDDLLLARKLTSGDRYCDTLLRAAVEFGRAEPLSGALGFGERLHPMGRRFERIMDAGVPRAYRLSALGFVVLLGLGFLLLPGLRSQTATQETAAEASPAWGPTEKGLKIGVQRVLGGAEILVHFKNVSTNDMALKLGTKLRNSEVRYPHAIRWRLIDPRGAAHKFEYLAGDVIGQPEPFIVRIPSGATYSLRFLSDNFCEILTGNRLSSLEHGRYDLMAKFEGNSVRATDYTDTAGLSLMPCWTGNVWSGKLSISVPKSRRASLPPPAPTASALIPGPGTNQGHRAEFTNEISTLLVATKAVVQLGDPIEVSLIVMNEGDRELTVDKSATAFDCFDVTDEEGQPVPYVGFMGQVFANSVTLQPSSTDLLVERLDLADKYLFQKPGRYAIRFRGGPAFPSVSNRVRPLTGIPASNPILVEVRPGQLGELDQIVARLLTVCPKGWSIEKSRRDQNEVAPFGRGRVRGYSAPIYRSYMAGEAVDLWFTKTEAPITSEQGSGASQYLGHTRGLHVYVSLAPKADSVWPDALEDISRALQLEDGKVGAGPAQPARRSSAAATGAETASAGSPTPPLFQIRLVLDAPSADSEPMTLAAKRGDETLTEVLNVAKAVLLDQTALKSATPSIDGLGRPIIDITFSEKGRSEFAQVTRLNIGRRLAIVIGGKLRVAPVVRAEITAGTALISGDFSKEEAKALADAIASSLTEQ